jgi:K(+)-stimulated pyrophosphate-energized sodium pump
VTDNAQSVYELSLIEAVPNVEALVKQEHGLTVNFERAKHLLEENDGAGNTPIVRSSSSRRTSSSKGWRKRR